MEKNIAVDHSAALADLLAVGSKRLKRIEDDFQVHIEPGGAGLWIRGEHEHQIEAAELVLRKLLALGEAGHDVSPQTVSYLAEQAIAGETAQVLSYAPDAICVTAKGRPIRCKTRGQEAYIKSIRENEVTFAVGPAGTGKTFLAVAMAVQAFRRGQYERIILTRPAVEAGERLGFLPGDLQSKVDPYMRPLYDALFEMMGAETYHMHLDRGAIEVSPLAYMRGRTLDSSFIILDEAQNTTPEQMKMFLTRLGYHSKAVVTGDITQIDLPRDSRSGLREVRRILHGIEGMDFIDLTDRDVVRNDLVQRIIRAYDAYDKRKGTRGS